MRDDGGILLMSSDGRLAIINSNDTSLGARNEGVPINGVAMSVTTQKNILFVLDRANSITGYDVDTLDPTGPRWELPATWLSASPGGTTVVAGDGAGRVWALAMTLEGARSS